MLRLCILLACLWPLPAYAGLSGLVRVIDGDTLQVGADLVRLSGIDAPEDAQTCVRPSGEIWPCGTWVSESVEALLSGVAVTCDNLGRDRYDRILARCRQNGDDIGATLVAAGMAVAYVRYASEYVLQEAAARSAGLGLWGSKFTMPEQYRAEARTAALPSDRNCRIKGNLSAFGAIYHLPGQQFYGRTRINPDNGERWFCSVDQARAAGWRPAAK